MMNRSSLHATTLALSFIGMTPALAADPTGDWLVKDGVAKIRVAQCNGNLWGAVAWEKIPGGRDKNNPDAALRNRPTLGIVTLVDFRKKAGVEEWEGKAYDAQTTGGMYDTTLKPIGNDKLEIKGCFLFICDGQTWTRVGPPIPPSLAGQGLAGMKGAPGSAAKATPVPKPPAPTATTATAPGAPKGPPATPDIGDVCLLGDVARLAH